MKKFQIGLLVIFVCLAVAVSGCIFEGSVKVVVNYTGSWNGTIKTDNGTQTIEGTGDKTIDLGKINGGITAKVEKKDNGNNTLIVSIIRGDEILSTMNTSTSSGQLNDATVAIRIV